MRRPKVLYQNPYFEVRYEPPFYWVHEEGAINGACVLAIHPGGGIVMVEVLRVALDGKRLELPRGRAENGESSLQCAQRELLEETGFTVEPENISLLGYVDPNSGILSSSVAIYFCCVLAERSDIIDTSEIDNVIIVPKRDFVDKIKSGGITDGFSLSAFALATAQGLI